MTVMRIALICYAIVSLVAIIVFVHLRGLEFEEKRSQTFLQRDVHTCSDDCPLPAILVFIDASNRVSGKTTHSIQEQYSQDPASMSFVFTVHPDAKFETVFSNLYYLTRQNGQSPIFIRKSDKQLPSLDIPYWPDGTDFSEFEERKFVIEVLPETTIRIRGGDRDYDQIQAALEKIMVLAKKPNIHIMIDPKADHYTKRTTRYICENIELECSYEDTR